MTPSATIVITTKNRKDELRRAVASALAQQTAVDVLVIDDGSTDGTSEMLRADFPSVRFVQHSNSRGYIVRRNEAAHLTTSHVVVSIDDDASFPSPHTVEQTLREFDHPRVGAVAIPFVNVLQDCAVRQRAPDTERVWITDRYIGTAHALRRNVFLSLGGYREHFVHQGEEGDYCLRMLAAGYVVRFGTADPIHHFESPNRNFARMDYYGFQNLILFGWHNVPFPEILTYLSSTTVKGLWHAARVGRPFNMIHGLMAGYLFPLSRKGWKSRDPVSWKISHLFRRLRKGPLSMEFVAPFLSDLPTFTGFVDNAV